jgi:SAM-dependent methyltransferase
VDYGSADSPTTRIDDSHVRRNSYQHPPAPVGLLRKSVLDVVEGIDGECAPAQGKPSGPAIPDEYGLHLLAEGLADNRLPDASFDRVYAIESSEHMVDKQRFFTEAARVLRPRRRLVVCAWLEGEAVRPWEVYGIC